MRVWRQGPGIVLGQPPRHDGWKEGEALGRREGCREDRERNLLKGG